MHNTEGSVEILNHSNKIQVKDVKGFWGVNYAASTKSEPLKDDDLDFRFEVAFNADLGAGYEALLFWVFREGKNLWVMNPSIFAEIGIHSYVLFKLYFWEWKMNIDALGYRIAPVDYQATWDLDNKSDYCHSVGAQQDVFDLDFHLESRVYEC